MATWRNFEIDCTNYLNNKYGVYAKFTSFGGTNSNIPDITVETNSGRFFCLEAKHCPAQSGQFVLLPDISTREFVYSSSNATSPNMSACIIIHHMNNFFEEYLEAGTKGKAIDFDNCTNVFSKWIIDYYKNKGVKYFITNNYIILPIERFSLYFNVNAMYRVKRSGSSSVGKSNLSTVINYIESSFKIHGYKCIGPKLFINAPFGMHNTIFMLDDSKYMFSQRGNDYEVRKLSNTDNANVIFSIQLKSNQYKEDLTVFENELIII